jgi:phage-related minor tail protein
LQNRAAAGRNVVEGATAGAAVASRSIEISGCVECEASQGISTIAAALKFIESFLRPRSARLSGLDEFENGAAAAREIVKPVFTIRSGGTAELCSSIEVAVFVGNQACLRLAAIGAALKGVED